MWGWLDTEVRNKQDIVENPDRINWFRVSPFIGVHLGCFLVFWVGFSFTALFIALFLYALRVFTLTGFYHRYFAHRTFKCNRFWTFVFAFIGGLAVQRGALWWASHHRHHHQHSDEETDVHSPIRHGFLWSHVLWFLANKNFTTRYSLIKDWQKYPELVMLNRYDLVPPLALILGLLLTGWLLQTFAPQLQTNPLQLLVWGFFISTVAVYHVTFSINSLSHTWGKRRYETSDTSRNNWVLALLTFGEGWHNNHHHYPATVRQGFYWYEIDISYYVLVMLSWLHIVKDLKKIPKKVLDSEQIS